jgi:DNA-binding Xre family transcriptional regulator
MGVVSLVKPVGKVSWKMRECMARRRIKNSVLADLVGVHATSISRLKAQDVLPEIGNDRIEQIRKAIEKLSIEQYGPCSMSELVEVLEDN